MPILFSLVAIKPPAMASRPGKEQKVAMITFVSTLSRARRDHDGQHQEQQPYFHSSFFKKRQQALNLQKFDNQEQSAAMLREFDFATSPSIKMTAIKIIPLTSIPLPKMFSQLHSIYSGKKQGSRFCAKIEHDSGKGFYGLFLAKYNRKVSERRPLRRDSRR